MFCLMLCYLFITSRYDVHFIVPNIKILPFWVQKRPKCQILPISLLNEELWYVKRGHHGQKAPKVVQICLDPQGKIGFVKVIFMYLVKWNENAYNNSLGVTESFAKETLFPECLSRSVLWPLNDSLWNFAAFSKLPSFYSLHFSLSPAYFCIIYYLLPSGWSYLSSGPVYKLIFSCCSYTILFQHFAVLC